MPGAPTDTNHPPLTHIKTAYHNPNPHPPTRSLCTDSPPQPTHAQAHKVALERAFTDAEQRTKDRFLESKDNLNRVNRSTAAAAALVLLHEGKRGADIADALKGQPSPLNGVTRIEAAASHTSPALLESVLINALATDGPLKALVKETVGAMGKEVSASTNAQRSNRKTLEPALGTVADLLKTASSKAACAPTAAPMKDLKYHGAAGHPAHAKGPARQHRDQSGHAELMAAAPLLAELMAALGEAWRTYSDGPPAAAMCLLIVVSRNCCSSCRYALPHIARLLKIDIVAQFRTSAGELSRPVRFAWDEEPPEAQ